MPEALPYLSIVLTARNDNYGGDFNTRLQNSVQWLSHFIEEHRVNAELVIVDDNPVAENLPLKDMIQWPVANSYLSIRLIEVSNQIHRRLVNPAIRKTVPLFEFNAKNIGIRRARGEYILCTNADILFHPELIKFIAQGAADKDHYYRTNRFDFRKTDTSSFQHALNKIEQNVYRIMLKGYGYTLKPDGIGLLKTAFYKFKNSLRIRRDLHKLATDLKKGLSIEQIYNAYAQRYHTHCSGDFMLMHRDHWFALRGYPEDTYISTHTDAIFTVMAGFSGLHEKVLKWPVYHQEHERRYKSDFDEVAHDADITAMFERFVNDSREMERTGKPKIVNGNDWGFGNDTFREVFI